MIFAGVNGYLDEVPVDQVVRYESELLEYFDQKYGDLIKALSQKKKIDDELKPKIEKALQAFNEEFSA